MACGRGLNEHKGIDLVFEREGKKIISLNLLSTKTSNRSIRKG